MTTRHLTLMTKKKQAEQNDTCVSNYNY